jgi:hypothetical protein
MKTKEPSDYSRNRGNPTSKPWPKDARGWARGWADFIHFHMHSISYIVVEKVSIGHQSATKSCSDAQPLNVVSLDAAQRLWLQKDSASQQGLASGTIEANQGTSLQRL